MTNKSSQPVDDLRVSFESRLDFEISVKQPPPSRLMPGQAVECVYEVRAPKQVNLSCEYNSMAFAHWSALYRRGNEAHLAHLPVKITLQEAARKNLASEE